MSHFVGILPLLGLPYGGTADAAGVTAVLDEWEYRVEAAINGHPVSAKIDTGTGYTTIPYKEAVRLGISVFSGEKLEAETVSGTVTFYRTQAQELRIGPYVLNNVDVDVTLTDEGTQNILLGMNVLQHFDVRMARQVMHIELLDTPTSQN